MQTPYDPGSTSPAAQRAFYFSYASGRRADSSGSWARTRPISLRSISAVKSVEMLRQSELLPTTGYVHGGCSPVGMKKRFPTFVDASAGSLPSMTVSAGKIGAQAELAPGDLLRITGGLLADLCV